MAPFETRSKLIKKYSHDFKRSQTTHSSFLIKQRLIDANFILVLLSKIEWIVFLYIT